MRLVLACVSDSEQPPAVVDDQVDAAVLFAAGGGLVGDGAGFAEANGFEAVVGVFEGFEDGVGRRCERLRLASPSSSLCPSTRTSFTLGWALIDERALQRGPLRQRGLSGGGGHHECSQQAEDQGVVDAPMLNLSAAEGRKGRIG